VSKRPWWLTFNLTALPAVHFELGKPMAKVSLTGLGSQFNDRRWPLFTVVGRRFGHV
jgi:hypothetical protein